MTKLHALGERQGDKYSAAIAALSWPLNEGFDSGLVSTETAPRDLEIAGLRITILSPDRPHLAAMLERWDVWRNGQAPIEDKPPASSGSGVVPMGRSPMPAILDVEELARPGRTDREPPNGSSIAFIAEFKGRRVLLAGDAHPDLLAASIAPLAAQDGGRYRVDVMKVSHHGSMNNTTPELVSLLDCHRFAVSTNGSIHGHPDPEAIARVLAFAPAGAKQLYFNYETDRTRPWGAARLREMHDYVCIWPAPAPGTCEIDIFATSPVWLSLSASARW